jgi:hypothetical protein
MQPSASSHETRESSSPCPGGRDGQGKVLFTGATLGDGLVLALRVDTIVIEPDLSRALSMCFEGQVSCLLVDLAAFGPKALTAIAHLQLIRPHQKVVLVQRESDPASLQGTVLEGLPQVWTRSRRHPSPTTSTSART